MHINYYSTKGKIRKSNQDKANYFIKNNDEFITILCDGMGGHLGGAIAAQLVVDTFVDEYKTANSFSNYNLVDIKKWFQEVLIKIKHFFSLTINENQEFENMGTTIVCAIRVKEHIYIANIGDSRAYIFNDQKLTQITTDHNLPNLLFKKGEITKEEKDTHPQKNILYNVFTMQHNGLVDWFSIPVSKSLLILMSDGIYNLLSELKMTQILQQKKPLSSLVVEFCNDANDNGGYDNNTILIGELNEN